MYVVATGRIGIRPGDSLRGAFVRFVFGTMAAVLAVAVGGYFALRSVALDEAKRDTRAKVVESAGLIEANLRDGILSGDADALAEVDELVLTRVLSASVVRVRIWSPEGEVLYSDDPEQIGGAFTLDAGQLALLREGGAEVEVSRLDRPENARDQGEGRLIEAYAAIRTPNGTPVLFELYERFESVTAGAQRLLRALAPPILGALTLIVLAQAPLVWSLARRLQRGHDEREQLLANAIEASGRERRRIASYLHDGAVQDIAGVAFGLAPIADAADHRGDGEESTALRAAVEQLRQNVRDLRALLVDLHPPHLAAGGLAAALDDLASPLVARGVAVTVEVASADQLSREHQALVFKVAQEALRNVVAYAHADTVDVRLEANNGIVRLTIGDDGRGFTVEQRVTRRKQGHLGLTLLEELAEQVGGTLRVSSSPGAGTEVELEVPVT